MLPEQISEPGEEFLISCPIYLVHKWPPMSEISYAVAWSHSNSINQDISLLYPDIPRVIIKGMLAYNNGLTVADNERIKELENDNK